MIMLVQRRLGELNFLLFFFFFFFFLGIFSNFLQIYFPWIKMLSPVLKILHFASSSSSWQVQELSNNPQIENLQNTGLTKIL